MNFEQKYYEVMETLRTVASTMKHGLCEPAERNACTKCAADRKLVKLLAEYKGPRVIAMDSSENDAKENQPRCRDCAASMFGQCDSRRSK